MSGRESTPPSLTAAAQAAIGRLLRPGSRAIDATVGNGHDTLFLARSVSPGGKVIGLDVQAAAIAATRTRLQAAGLDETVELQQIGHQDLAAAVPADWPGTVSAVMFNLGYLPGSDKRVVTQPDTTLRGLASAVGMLSPSGMLSVVVYPGHAGGGAEAGAVEHWASTLPDDWFVQRMTSPGPSLFLVGRQHRQNRSA
jgi:predicted methyltransferase